MSVTHLGSAILGAAGTAALAIAACGGGGGANGLGERHGDRRGGAAGPKQGGTLTMLWKDDVDSIDPGITYSAGGLLVGRATQRAVMAFAPDDITSPVADLAAARPEVSADGKQVTVRLRDRVHFSPPVDREVTSADVKYGIERGFFRTVLNPYASVHFGDILGAKPGLAPGTRIAGIQTPDDRTVVFRLRHGTGRGLANALTLLLTAPVPREHALRYDRRNPSTYGRHQVATGPYMIRADARGRAVGHQPGVRLHLVRNPRWDPTTDFRPAHVDEIDMRQGNDDDALTARRILRGRGLVSGESSAPGGVIKEALRRARDQIALPSTNGGSWVALNTQLEPFDDVNVRRAVVAGFDRTAMRLAMGGDAVTTPSTHFIPPGTPGFQEAGGAAGPELDFLGDPRGDRTLAARYLRKAGYDSGRYEGDGQILMVGIAGGASQSAAEVAEHSLERLGFDVKLRLVSFEALISRFCGSPRAQVHVCPNFSWARDFADGQTILDATFNGEAIVAAGNSNQSQLDEPAINQAMLRARLVVDPSKRAKAWGAIDRMVTAQAAAIPISWDRVALVRSKDVAGVVAGHLALWDPTFTWLR